MKLGAVYTAPWGRYVVHREGPPVVLRSLERYAAFILDPSPADYTAAARNDSPGAPASVTREDCPRALPQAHDAGAPVETTSPELEHTDLGGERADAARKQTPLAGEAEQPGAVVPPSPYAGTLPPSSSPHPGPWRPGANVLRARGLPAWRPCLSRVRGDYGEILAGEHAWYLDDGHDVSLYCPTCRASRPRVAMGPRPWVARIRAALKVGDVELAHELIRLGPHSAPARLDENARAAAQVVHYDVKSANRQPTPVDEIERPPAPLVHRDLKPSNVQHAWSAEITIVCENVRAGLDFRALLYDRATRRHYGGSAPTPLEALAWCLDDYCARAVHGLPWTLARKSTDTPGSRFAASPPRKKAA